MYKGLDILPKTLIFIIFCLFLPPPRHSSCSRCISIGSRGPELYFDSDSRPCDVSSMSISLRAAQFNSRSPFRYIISELTSKSCSLSIRHIHFRGEHGLPTYVVTHSRHDLNPSSSYLYPAASCLQDRIPGQGHKEIVG